MAALGHQYGARHSLTDGRVARDLPLAPTRWVGKDLASSLPFLTFAVWLRSASHRQMAPCFKSWTARSAARAVIAM